MTRTLSPDQERLRDYVRELARDRGITPAAALAALRMGHHAPTFDVPAHVAEALTAGTPEMAQRWNMTEREITDLADLIDLTEDADRAVPTSEITLQQHEPDYLVEPEDPERAAFTRGLRELASWLAQHPDVPTPSMMMPGHQFPTERPLFRIFIGSLYDPRRRLASIARAMAAPGVMVHKHQDDTSFWVWREFAGIAVAARTFREDVCERVVVGTETVEAEEDACPEPGCNAALTTVDVGKPGREVTVCSVNAGHYQAAQPGKRVVETEREIVEWRCPTLLADQDGGDG